MRLKKWKFQKLDCDKWVQLFVAYCTIIHARTKATGALGVGLMLYNRDGDKLKGHARAVSLARSSDVTHIVVFETLPGQAQGEVELSTIERESAWLIMI